MTDLSIQVPSDVAANLAPLRDALDGAGLGVLMLGTDGGYLHTYDEDGFIVDFPAPIRAQVAAVVASYEPPAPPPNGWTIIRSLIPYSEGPEDVLVLLDMQAALMGGADPED